MDANPLASGATSQGKAIVVGDDAVQIKKYPNRRYYDASRSRHIRLEEVYELVLSGQNVQITDSRSGADLTNRVLLRILLDRESVKLDLVPSIFMHLMIRMNPQGLRDSFERFYGPVLDTFAASQRRFNAHVLKGTGASASSPFDRARRRADTFSPEVAPSGAPGATSFDREPLQADPRGDARWRRDRRQVSNRTHTGSVCSTLGRTDAINHEERVSPRQYRTATEGRSQRDARGAESGGQQRSLTESAALRDYE